MPRASRKKTLQHEQDQEKEPVDSSSQVIDEPEQQILKKQLSKKEKQALRREKRKNKQSKKATSSTTPHENSSSDSEGSNSDDSSEDVESQQHIASKKKPSNVSLVPFENRSEKQKAQLTLQKKVVSEHKNIKVDPNERDISSSLATVRFLRNNEKGLEKLVSNYHLKVKKHSHFSNLISLKYDMLKSPFSTEIVQECRGLVLDRDRNYKVVCYPFKKFFNYGEKYNASKDINWKEAKVYEKVDGSLCTLYYYGDMWWISTTGTASGNGYLHKKNKTFDKVFWEIWYQLQYKFPDPSLNKIYMFELFTKEHEIIVKPDRDRIILLGVRDMNTLKEEDPQPHAEKMGWECVAMYPLLSSIGKVFDAAKNLDPSQHEGFVICDNNFNRIKIKSPRYVALSHLLSMDGEGDGGEADSKSEAILEDNQENSPTRKRKMLQIVRNNESSEFLAYYPNLEEIHNIVRGEYNQLLKLTKHIATDIKTKYYSNNEEEKSNKDAILNFIQRKCQTDYCSEFISILAVNVPADKSEELEKEMKSSKKFAKIIKHTLLIAVYQELFGQKSCEQIYKDVELGTLFELMNFASSI
ncbi:hypothetical protein C9374_010421 [Naegleria lovaniensis]|uniref:T4 RNA ligase 1-like N-terminal domain-containing protein n=1 Tax=Naegleria lovaniensis TaxID=51637 RepID=A0AA88KJ97_NAELO|nr:uncharacterized protein C9374_010421 [Naegleria lovaniensis]KAG2374677.1 hypothetical protein C9374_010421 [Naegleria lovaniensis]